MRIAAYSKNFILFIYVLGYLCFDLRTKTFTCSTTKRWIIKNMPNFKNLWTHTQLSAWSFISISSFLNICCSFSLIFIKNLSCKHINLLPFNKIKNIIWFYWTTFDISLKVLSIYLLLIAINLKWFAFSLLFLIR